ncbi:MAG: hypothetical protein KDI68_15125 [Gammaproteobacteria bacterium]|nr:hypothetical protein [Gammaproteobacteria bacterium]
MRTSFAMPLLLLILALLTACQALAGAPRTVEQVVEKLRHNAVSRLEPRFRFAGIEWPPQEVQLMAIKENRTLELWARTGTQWRHIRDYRIKGMSGGYGPKLKEGDRQVPEGLYNIAGLNPNSSFHLSLGVNYPNEFDRAMARNSGRSGLGGDIFIHGNRVSRGCLAIGDKGIEDLFVLTAMLGKEQVKLLISPVDFRTYSTDSLIGNTPAWIGDLYHTISERMRQFPRAR